MPNLYPIVDGGRDGLGAHEVIVCSPAHDRQLDALSLDAATAVFVTMRDRAAHHLDAGLTYAAPFVNSGRPSGASIEHPHAQLVALSFVPPLVDTLLARFARAGRDLVVDNIDAAADRACLVRKAGAVSWCPPGGEHAVRRSHRAADGRIVLRPEHRRRPRALHRGGCRTHSRASTPRWATSPTTSSCTPRHAPTLVRSTGGPTSTPRVGVYGGFELGTGVWVNPVAPEHAAATLRDAT